MRYMYRLNKWNWDIKCVEVLGETSAYLDVLCEDLWSKKMKHMRERRECSRHHYFESWQEANDYAVRKAEDEAVRLGEKSRKAHELVETLLSRQEPT